MPPPLNRTPPAIDNPAPAVPCPRCGRPLREVLTDGLPYLAGEQDPTIADIPVLGCRRCRLIAAHVPGMLPEWRSDDLPGLYDRLADDAMQAVRHRHFLTADAGDGIFGW